MKTKLISILFLLLSAGVNSYAQERLVGIDKPKAGQELTLDYSNATGPLTGRDTLTCVIYMCRDYVWSLDDVTLERKSATAWHGSYKLPDDCAFFALSMRAGDAYNRVVDNNDENGGWVYMTSTADGMALPGGFSAFASFRCPKLYQTSGSYYSNFSINEEAEMMWMNKEVQFFPNRMPDFIDLYMRNVQLMSGENYPKTIGHFFEMAQKDFKDNEFVLSTFESLYRFTIKDEAKADSILNAMYKLYPAGAASRMKAFKAAESLTGNEAADAIEAFYDRFPQKDCKESKHFSYQNFMYYNLSRVYAQALFDGKQYDRLVNNLYRFDFKALSEMYRWNIFRHFRLHGVGNDTLYRVAKPLMSLLVERRQDGSTMDGGGYMTPSEAQLMADYQFYERLGCHIKLLNEMRKYDEAYSMFKYFDNEEMAFMDASVNEARYNVLKSLDRQDEATALLKMAIKYNTVTTGLLAELKLTSGITDETKFQTYLDGLKGEKQKQSLEKAVKAGMMNVEIPSFKLTDSNGKTVSIDQYKGKIVVIDFWANWCAPCKAAMEGMKLAVQKYASDPDVVILFVNTMDAGYEGSKSVTEKFMQRKGYAGFNVMYDRKPQGSKEYNEAFRIFAQKFSSSGIPRKVIIKDGRLLYTAEGYSGSPSQLCDEISCAVEMIKK